MTAHAEPRFWGAIPAAGIGRRMGASIPKQYLELRGRKVVEHSVAALLEHPAIGGVCVAVAAGDPWWPRTGCADHGAIIPAVGGAERVWSVRNMLNALLAHGAAVADWVLVHDAARPCLRREDVDRLIAACGEHDVGGLLGMPVRDTMKRIDGDGKVLRGEPREGLWHAFTPQMFRLGPLRTAIEDAVAAGAIVTDEAAAMERIGAKPLMVEGRADNIKITRPGDLELAEFFLSVG